MTVAFYTLGCKVNQNETGALTRLFEDNGFVVTADEIADIYIVNSCTVTASGDKKSRQWLRRAKRQNPNSVTVLTGCYPQAFPDEAAAVLQADIVTGSSEKSKIIDKIYEFLRTKNRIVDISAHTKEEKFEELPTEKLMHHTRAFVKIEDGCARHCTYCVIPRARGTVRSRDEENILRELRELVAAGYKEFVLTGINLSSYGTDTSTSLADITVKACEVNGVARVRLGSLEPDMMDEKCIETLRKATKLCHQFHLSLQSGCNATLKRMGRLYTKEEYLAVVQNLRNAFPNAVFTTDIIVGFPGETDADFDESLEFVKAIGFLKVHVFSYSKREGTPATRLPCQIDETVKVTRSRQLQATAELVRAAIIGNMIGNEENVLLESPINTHTFTGYTTSYVPVIVRADGHKTGEIIKVTLLEYDTERCKAVYNPANK